QDICRDFNEAFSREWLETNGIGGYASSTVSGANSRRYHGLLIAATKPPLGRMVLLSKLEETLIVDSERYDLSSNQYPGTIHPDGYKYLTGFRLDPFPVWTFDVNGIEFEKSVFMVHGENTTVCQWKIKNKSAIRNPQSALEIRPLLAFRDHHHLRQEDSAFDPRFETGQNQLSFTPYAEMPTLYLANNATEIEPSGVWYRNFEYEIERERGFDFTEDLFQPCVLRFDVNESATVIASTEPQHETDVGKLKKAEMKRRALLVAKAKAKEPFSRQLVLAADQFIVDRGTGKTVIAGYHWFSDWGRDTMIALNGLTLATNRPEIAKSILTEFSNHISEGMLPNRFPDAGETPDYNTVDATLWFFEAIRAYAEATGDHDFVRETLYDKLVDIIDWHVRGTRYQIHVDLDGLLYAGEPGVQLTWMDAKIGDWVVTPRTGKPVEIQALWYNALRIMSDLAARFGDADRQPRYFEMAEIARDSFNGQFWNASENCLYDVVNGPERDASVRPNQIFAVSLPHSILASERARAVVDKVEAELLTPLGLRSLSPHDPQYAPIYLGSPLQRDGSYHQGTVWGWLIGHFVDAYRKVHAKEKGLDKKVTEILAGFESHLTEAMVGQIAEIFDGDAPNLPRGAAAQAWSVAEVLRSLS
ncbi:MAG TPA: amylo-alpha-1,6-glucosidase, partial [Pyrinomonadaceae bacterium]|nr:amylo-alpha-1,6-glucosidase [Pyrinomonadaceae bacterium]